MTNFAVYQIDFVAQAAGKRVASTKRRIRWRFGFPNKEALSAGRTGPDCRGEEHDVTVVWSITSGKRQITMDGKEIHFSSSRAGVLDFSWTTKGNHVIKVLCHAAPPMQSVPGFRQYDLSVDGQSFFTMPKMFQMGVNGATARGGPGGGYSNPVSPISVDSGYPVSGAQEEADLRRAIQESLEESRRHLEKRSSAAGTPGYAANQSGGQSVDGDLLGFDSPPPAQGVSSGQSVSGMSYYSAPPSYSQPPYASPQPYQSPNASSNASVGPGAIVPSHGPPGGYYQGAPPAAAQAYGYGSPTPVPPAPAPTPAQPNYGAPPPPQQQQQPQQQQYQQPVQQMNYMNVAPPPQQDVFGLNSPPQDDPFAPKPPPPQDLTTLVMGAYQNGPMPTTPMAGGEGFTPQTPQQQQQQNGGTPQSMNTLAVTAEEEAPVDELTKAMKNLVNFDRIDEPAEGEVKLTMIKKEEAKKKSPSGKSVPLPPVGSTVVGSGATLSQIKGVQHGQRTLKPTADGVMRAPPPGAFAPGAAATGALVVHGQGPPALHQPQGFGLGARLPNGGFSQQQQAPAMGFQQPQYR